MTKKKRKKFKEGIEEDSNFEKGNIWDFSKSKEKAIEEIRVERFIVEQMDRYIRLHKEHEKDLSYIG